jgi:hypothetical protein
VLLPTATAVVRMTTLSQLVLVAVQVVLPSP